MEQGWIKIMDQVMKPAQGEPDLLSLGGRLDPVKRNAVRDKAH